MTNHGICAQFRAIPLLVMYRLGDTMGRRRNSNRSDETSDFSNDPKELLHKLITPHYPQVAPKTVTHTSPKLYRAIEDRRTYHPDGPQRPARSLQKATHRVVLPTHPKAASKSQRPFKGLPRTVQFEAPKQVLVCIRRNARKQVLFALKKTGKGARARRHRQSEYSNIRC